jgi:hypothetical protein
MIFFNHLSDNSKIFINNAPGGSGQELAYFGGNFFTFFSIIFAMF